jgi:hypothetical protein
VHHVALAAVLTLAPLAGAAAMNLQQFVEKADAVEKKGMMALFSSDYKALKREIEASSLQLRAERLAAVKASRRPAYCPTGKGGMDVEELLAHFRAIPPAQRARLEVKDGLRSFYAKKHPCR